MRSPQTQHGIIERSRSCSAIYSFRRPVLKCVLRGGTLAIFFIILYYIIKMRQLWQGSIGNANTNIGNLQISLSFIPKKFKILSCYAADTAIIYTQYVLNSDLVNNGTTLGIASFHQRFTTDYIDIPNFQNHKYYNFWVNDLAGSAVNLQANRYVVFVLEFSD